MRELPRSLTRRIYRDHFWKPLSLSAVAEIASPELAREISEVAVVNVGTAEVAT